VLRQFTEKQPAARFVLMTGYGSAAGALDATAIGAYDYLVKPFNVDDILNLAQVVREQHQTRLKHKNSKIELPAPGYVSDIPLIGKSTKFIDSLKLVGRVATTNMPVLITGESGTGKEIVARAIHQRSARADKSFVAVNCGAIPFELIESELFGHAKGAFTGAERERQGLWEEADGGTIFLDEITETHLLFQVKLLRALQEGEIRRVGSNQTLKTDVRVITASNRDVEEEVRSGRFRQDLMYRLNAVTIHLPPLRDRAEDIPLLAEYFANRVRPIEAPPVKFSPAALKALENYRWQGNIRELENAVLHAVSLCDNVIYPEHLPAHVMQVKKEAPLVSGEFEASHKPSFETDNKWLSLAQMEAEYVARVLAHTGGNKQAAARILRIDRKTLARIINRSNLTGEQNHSKINELLESK
ncbi:MAG TPA: sigma-54 dependent transcriptional regulator, partial [Pyrinomonadaceae bacterium]|nr:sigma-54 dependent transcriptional regulator [Pyrinomonadaceae bacterium]